VKQHTNLGLSILGHKLAGLGDGEGLKRLRGTRIRSTACSLSSNVQMHHLGSHLHTPVKARGGRAGANKLLNLCQGE
jgi:hypothetical protein